MNSLSDPVSTPPIKQDGRKRKERTPAQKEAYQRMVEARKQKKLQLNAAATPESVAIADVWYSNHELAKEKRRKQKMDDMEKVITSRLDQYHAKILDELQKPVASFLENFLLYDEEEETTDNTRAGKPPSAQTAQKQQHTEPEIVAPAASSSSRNTGGAYLLSSTRKRKPTTRFF